MPSALILYQFFYPDDVVSAILLTELAEGLAARGWRVVAMPCNRSCRTGETYAGLSFYRGVTIKRIWRPAFPQNKGWGRMANCLWMLGAWTLRMVVAEADLVIIGTDPILSAVVAVPSKFLRPGLRIVHWCHDLYPEAAVADGILKPGPLLNLLRRVMAASYRKIDLLADLGECMGRRLAEYGSSASRVRLWPWAIAEPAVVPEIDSVQRAAVFGHSRLAILYSGNFGRAHSFTELLTIARQMRDVDAHFSFGIRGNRLAEVQKAITKDDHNVSVAPFAPADELQARLSCADIHVVSLRPEWSGTVVPSKFFGALATGRPVLFIGSEECSIAQIIKRYGLGWVCSEGEEGQMAQHLRVLANDMSSLGALQERCHRVYRTCFSREILLDAFDQDLRNLWLALQDGGAEAKRPAVFADGGSLERK